MRRLATIAIATLALSACNPEQPAEPPSDGQTVTPGEAADLFARHCVLCHGERGDGRGPRRASLYRKPPDFRDPLWREDKTARRLRRSIREGRPGTDMPSWRRLGEPAIAGLAEYVLHLGSEER